MSAMEVQKDIRVEIHKNNRHRLTPPAHPSVLFLQFVGRHEGPGNAFNGVESLCQISVLRHRLQSFFLRHHGDESFVSAFAGLVGVHKHFPESIDRKQHAMIEIKIYGNGPDFIKLFPNGFANDLRDPLIVPTTRTPEIPLGMVP